MKIIFMFALSTAILFVDAFYAMLVTGSLLRIAQIAILPHRL